MDYFKISRVCKKLSTLEYPKLPSKAEAWVETDPPVLTTWQSTHLKTWLMGSEIHSSLVFIKSQEVILTSSLPPSRKMVVGVGGFWNN